MKVQKTSPLVWFFLILGIAIAAVLIYAFIKFDVIQNFTMDDGIGRLCILIIGWLVLFAIPAIFISISLKIIISNYHKYQQTSEFYSEQETQSQNQPESPKYDWTIVKIGLPIALFLLTIGVIIIIDTNQIKSKCIETQATVIEEWYESVSQAKCTVLEYEVEGKKMVDTVYDSKTTFPKTVYVGPEYPHKILYCKNQRLVIILFFCVTGIFIAVVSFLFLGGENENFDSKKIKNS